MATQVEFTKKLASKGYTHKECAMIIDDFLKTITEFLEVGDSVHFRDFGKFEVRRRKSRASYSVITREPIEIPSFNSVHFTMGKMLRSSVNNDAFHDIDEEV